VEREYSDTYVTTIFSWESSLASLRLDEGHKKIKNTYSSKSDKRLGKRVGYHYLPECKNVCRLLTDPELVIVGESSEQKKKS